jgi:hypothetical protein
MTNAQTQHIYFFFPPWLSIPRKIWFQPYLSSALSFLNGDYNTLGRLIYPSTLSVQQTCVHFLCVSVKPLIDVCIIHISVQYTSHHVPERLSL